MITKIRVAYNLGFSYALSMESFSAYNDAAKFKYSTIRVKNAFFRGYKTGKEKLSEVQKEITTGEIVFVKDQGECEDILSGRKILDASLLVPDAA